MPTTAWSTLRADVNRELGYWSFTSSNITTTTVVAAELTAPFPTDDDLTSWFVLIEAGTNAGAIRRVSSYTASSGTITIAGANLTADATARACSVYRFHPTRTQQFFNRASAVLFPQIAQIRDIATLVTGLRQFRYLLPSTVRDGPVQLYLDNRDPAVTMAQNVLTNAGFETWAAGTPTGWTRVGNDDTLQEQVTTTPANYAVLQDASSCRLLTAATTTQTLLQTVTPAVATQGTEVNFSIWVYCRTATRIRARISGTNVVSSPVRGSYHGGGGWELLIASADLNSAATAFDVGVEVDSGGALSTYLDEALCLVGQSEAADREWTPLVHWRWIPPIDGAANGGYIEFDSDLPAKRRIRVLGRRPLSSVTADADTVEVDGEQLEIIYDQARFFIIMDALSNIPAQVRSYWSDRAADYRLRVGEALNSGRIVKTMPYRFQVPDAEY